MNRCSLLREANPQPLRLKTSDVQSWRYFRRKLVSRKNWFTEFAEACQPRSLNGSMPPPCPLRFRVKVQKIISSEFTS